MRRWLPLALLTLVAAVLAWLNRSPWPAWVLLGAVVPVIAALTGRLPRGRPVLGGVAWLLAAALVIATALPSPPPERRPAAVAGVVTAAVPTLQGPVTGIRDDARGVEVFAGIPYAQPPVGPLRWRAPRPPQPREVVLAADRFSAVPVQPTSTFASRALSRIVQVPLEDTLLNPYPVSEDSLTLNIWRSTDPADERSPVLVYLPGGGFATGSGALPLYDGAALAARRDVVTVTVSYRLGVLGFLAHPELSAESGRDASGNYGILDQLAALDWVRANIAAFGGDPDRVTVAGESAGGESVCILGSTPLAEGLVDGLIAGSGACMGTTGDTGRGDQTDTQAVAEDAGRRLGERLGGTGVEEMRRMPVERVLDAADELDGHWRPSVDGHVLPRPPTDVYAAGDQLDVPTLVGSNANEASLALAAPPDVDVESYRASVRRTHHTEADRYLRLYPGRTEEEVLASTLQAQTDAVMTRAMLRWAQLQSSTGQAEAYLYFFTHVPPEKGLERFGAYHGAEVGYAYDNLDAVGDLELGEADHRLRQQMTGYWLNFVRTGDPNGPGLPVWPTHEQAPEQVLELGRDGARMAPRPRPDAVDLWTEHDGPIA